MILSRTEEWTARYSRQILLAPIGGIGQEKLNNQSILLVGMGAMARPFFLYGVGAGIGRWGLLADDEVGCLNLQKLAKERNPDVAVEIFLPGQQSENIEQWLGEWSLVVDVSNENDTRLLWAKLCQAGAPRLFSAWSQGVDGWIAQSPCPFCLARQPDSSGTAGGAVAAMVPGLLGSILAQQSIQYLLEPAITKHESRLTVFAGETANFITQSPHISPDCPTCHIVDD